MDIDNIIMNVVLCSWANIITITSSNSVWNKTQVIGIFRKDIRKLKIGSCRLYKEITQLI